MPDIIAAYPQPLPYEKSIHQKVKEGMAIEIVLDEDHQNYILGRRIKGEGYPASAIDKAEWKFYHAAGFKEHLNTRVLFRVCRDNDL